MLKQVVALNEGKILFYGIYNPEQIYGELDNVFRHYGMEKHDKGLYAGGQWEYHGAAVLYLKKQSWFMTYVEKWLWFGREEYPEMAEDLVAHYKRKGLIPS